MNASELLRTLGGALAPGLGIKPTPGVSSAGGLDFASLLRRAESGQLESGRTLHIDESAGVELSDDQLSRLNQAVDASEAAGARKVFATIDGLGVVIDVPSRTIESVAPLNSAQEGRVLPANVMVGVDAVVAVPNSDGGNGSGEYGSLSFQGLASSLGPIGRIENESLMTRLGSFPDARSK